MILPTTEVTTTMINSNKVMSTIMRPKLTKLMEGKRRDIG